MNSTFLLLSIFACSFFSAQQASDYPYIMVPESFSAKKLNQYDLKKTLISNASKKNFKILTENEVAWPEQAQQNPCSVLKADLQDISTMLRNKVRIVLQDCNNKTFTFDGASFEKSYEDGFPDALNIAAKNIPASKGILPAVTAQIPIKKAEAVSIPVPIVETKVPMASAMEFISGNQKVQKINISDNQFIFTRENSSAPFAVFKKSLKDGIFHVQLENKAQAIGYYENGNLIIESLQQNGEPVKQIFVPKN